MSYLINIFGTDHQIESATVQHTTLTMLVDENNAVKGSSKNGELQNFCNRFSSAGQREPVLAKLQNDCHSYPFQATL